VPDLAAVSYYLHRVDPQTPLEESLAAIRDYRGQVALALDVGLVNRLDVPLAQLAAAGIDLVGTINL
jgi:aryl-alcohol dehydrogenase-like predicted oxidoreductase